MKKKMKLEQKMESKMEPKIELSVVTVTYNEKENIKLFIEAINKVFLDNNIIGEVVVVDDNSPDGTSAVVEELNKKFPHTVLIVRPGKMGIGSAYKTGVDGACGEVVALLDADLSHPPATLFQMYQLATNGTIVFGSRYLGETKFETDFAHLIGTRLLNGWVSFMLGTGMRDHTNGYVCVQRGVLRKVFEESTVHGVAPFDHILYGITIAGVARKLGIPIVEIKAPYNKRIHGETKIPFLWGLKVVFGDMWYALRLRFKLR